MKDRVVILPKGKKLLSAMGEQFKLARLRRKLSAEQVAERAGISRGTLWQIEKGISSVSLGAYFQVLLVLGLEEDILNLAGDDELGRKLQDAGLIPKDRVRRNTGLKFKDQKKKSGTLKGTSS